MAKLTKRIVDAAEAQDKDYVIWDDELPGFGLRVFTSGKRSYDREYEPILRNMVESALKQEAPIYEDVLVSRIARAHGFQRSGDRIQTAVARVLGRRYRKTHEDGRAVIWAESSPEGCLVSYRESQPEIRSHADTPIAELASLALPFIRVRLSDEDILYRMASHFQLGRLSNELLYCITSITPRARYYAFFPWAMQDYNEHEHLTKHDRGRIQGVLPAVWPEE